MPQLPRMKFQEEPCKRFELEEGNHNAAMLQARQLVDRLHTTAKQGIIQGSGLISAKLQLVGFFGWLG